MNIRFQIALVVLVAVAPFSYADTTSSWFPGALYAKITPALPTNFIVVSASPEAKGTKAMDILEGVLWASERTARQFEFGGNGKLNGAKEPLFHVAITPLVMQKPGTDQFTNEKDLEAKSAAAGLKKAKVTKTKWGDYPVLSMTFENPLDGATMFVAWVGVNSPDGWTVLINYRVPQGKGHPTKEELEIWKRFLSETKNPK